MAVAAAAAVAAYAMFTVATFSHGRLNQRRKTPDNSRAARD